MNKVYTTWERFISALLIMTISAPFIVPGVASAAELISNSDLQSELSGSSKFEMVYSPSIKYTKSKYINETSSQAAEDQSIEQFHQKLLTFSKRNLPEIRSTNWIPISGEVTFFIPTEKVEYLYGKRIGDVYTQQQLIQTQIKRLIGRAYIDEAITKNEHQISKLYTNSLRLAQENLGFTYKFGDNLPTNAANSFGRDFIWPEYRTVNGESLLVPIVHLQDTTIANRGIEGKHTVEFVASRATFKSVEIVNSNIKLNRDTVFSSLGDMIIDENSSINIDDSKVRLYAGVSFVYDGAGDLQGFSTGTLFNYGKINSKRNVDIVAGNYVQQTLVHRFATATGFGDRLGVISSINSGTGINIQVYNDVKLAGAYLNGGSGNIYIKADGSIYIGSVQLASLEQINRQGYSSSASETTFFQTVLTTEQSIMLMATGRIEITGAQLLADKGVIELLAKSGISIINDLEQTSFESKSKYRKNTDTISQLQTIVSRAALDAGKGVVIHTVEGDIILKAVDIESTEGASLLADNGRVNLLLAKEIDHYYRQKVDQNFWRIKTTTQTDQTESAVYTSVVGGMKVTASKGITLELGQDEGITKEQVLQQMAGVDSLKWMKQLAESEQMKCPPARNSERRWMEDGSYNIHLEEDFAECTSTFDVVYQKLEQIQERDRTRALTPAAMAIIAIAVAVALGPQGLDLAGKLGTATGPITSVTSVIGEKAVAAGIQTLATQAASSLAAGNSITTTLETMSSSESLKSLAVSMITAGLMDKYGKEGLKLFGESKDTLISLGNQAANAVMVATIKAGTTWAVNGGNFESFRDSFKQQIMAYGINALGTHMVDKINQSLNIFSESSMDVALNYISNAAASCVIAVANGNNSGSQTSGETACVTAAGASVVGTYIGKNQALSEKTRDVANKLKEDYEEEFRKTLGPNPTAFDIRDASYSIGFTRLPVYKNELVKLLNDGADLSKLYVALTVFAAGGSADQINISAEFVEKNINNVNAVRALYFANLLGASLTAALAEHKIIIENPPAEDDENKNIMNVSNSPAVNKHIRAFSNQENDPYTWEEAKQNIKESLKDQNVSDAEIDAVLEQIDAKALFDDVNEVGLNITNSRRISSARWSFTHKSPLDPASGFGWRELFSELGKKDANDHGKGILSPKPRVQVAVAEGMLLLEPLAIPIANTSDKLHEIINANEDVAIAIQVVSFLISPVSTVASEVYSASPAGKATGDAIVKVHEHGVNWVYEGGDKRIQSKANISQTMSGVKSIIDISTSQFVPQVKNGTYALLITAREKFEDKGYKIKNIVDIGNGHKRYETNAGNFIIFNVEDKEAVLRAYQDYKANNKSGTTAMSIEDFEINAANKAYNPDTKRFSDIDDGRPVAYKAQSTLTKLYNVDEFDTGRKTQLVAGKQMTFAEIATEKEKVRQLKAQTTNKEELNKLNARERDLSEAGALLKAEAYAESLGKQYNAKTVEVLPNEWPDDSKNINYDKVVKITGNDGSVTIVIIESKGGSSQLGSRLTTDKSERAQQGTAEYHKSIMADMQAKLERMENARPIGATSDYDKKLSDMRATIKAIADIEPKYHVVRTTYDANGTPSNITAEQFPELPKTGG